ncbi:MAG TPA: cytochrome b/b6 domain-containing protein [Trinickia sp.]|nr:cytochrome b/b6 domain-containing protein [Trinickia sp.]
MATPQARERERPHPAPAQRGALVHPAWVRITHWLNALAAIVMMLSGWQIYDASPIFAHFMFPTSIALGGWLAGALQWHFAAMWLLLANGIVYLVLSVATGRLFLKFFPLSPREVWRDLASALTGRLSHADLSRYNAVQKLAYLAVILDLIVLALSGLAIWKSVQFPLLRELLGGYDTARVVHFFAMAFLAAFLVVHLVMVALVPRSLIAMLRGR